MVSIIILYHNLMGLLSYLKSVVNRNVVMRRIRVCCGVNAVLVSIDSSAGEKMRAVRQETINRRAGLQTVKCFSSLANGTTRFTLQYINAESPCFQKTNTIG